MLDIRLLSQGDPALLDPLFKFLNGLTKGHPELGRKGAVCPYASAGLKSGDFYFSTVETASEKDVRRAIAGSLQPFRRLEGGLKKSLVILFPGLSGGLTVFLDKAHKDFRIHFVRRKLMLGVFHPREVSEGLHNESFHPSVCEVPMAVVRNMVAGDKVFFEKSFEQRPDDPLAAESLMVHQSFFPEAYGG